MLLALTWAFSLKGRTLQRETVIAVHLAPEFPVAVRLPFPMLLHVMRGCLRAAAWG